MTWNYDMSEAPRGRTETRIVKRNAGEDLVREVFVQERIIAAVRGEDVVLVSWWIPNAGRWNLFATGEEPLAWQPFPKHPEE